MGAILSAINPTQDFLARMGGRHLFDMGASTVKYGKTVLTFIAVVFMKSFFSYVYGTEKLSMQGNTVQTSI